MHQNALGSHEAGVQANNRDSGLICFAALTGLDAAEIQSLFLAKPARLLADLGLTRDDESAVLKLLASIPEASRPQAAFARQRILIDTRGWRETSEAIACLPVLLDAIFRERQVRFLYRHQDCEPGERSGSPLGLVAKGSVWYLVALVDTHVKTYRVSRVSSAEMLDEAVQQVEQFDLARYWEQSASQFRETLPRFHATFLADPSIMRWVRYRGWRLEEEQVQERGVRIRIRFDIEEEAVQFALSFGSSIEVIEPAEVRGKVVSAARALLQRYSP